ncbi:MAG: phosphoglycerate kinase [Parachlamydiaceae bacterium]
MVALKDLSIRNKRALVRVDFNVPLDEQGKILDPSRIVSALPTIRYLLEQGCSIVLMSHMGRPKGGKEPKLSLKVCAQALSDLLGKQVVIAPDCVGPEVKKLVDALKPGEILMLENLRFYPAEEKPELDPEFAKQLASYGDFYVDDAFGCAHRAHSSIVPVAKFFPGKSAEGFLLEKERKALSQLLNDPKRPFLAILGGAKVSSKLGVIHSLLEKVDVLAIGGAMAFTFLKAKGMQVGSSLVEDSLIKEAEGVIKACENKKIPLLLPLDAVVAAEPAVSAVTNTIALNQGIPQGMKGLDIGPQTVDLFIGQIKLAKTIFWNGPMGVFEVKPFAQGTYAIAKAFGESGATTVAGGGETVAALMQTPYKDKVSHLSTGGGASLELIEFGTLPGIDAVK